MKMNLSELKEKTLFDWFKDTRFSDIQQTSKYSYTDAYIPSLNVYVEFKCRREHYDALLIEKAKWKYLHKLSNCRYINSTPRGIYSFNMSVMAQPSWHMRVMPRTTNFENKDKIIKEVGYLHIRQAVELTDSFLEYNLDN
jgi:hypothetical protein